MKIKKISASAYQAVDPADNAVLICFSTRRQNYDYRNAQSAEVDKARNDLFGILSLDIDKTVFPKQTHSAHVYKIKRSDLGKGAFDFESGIDDTDALVTDLQEAVLCMLSADCLPVMFYGHRPAVLAVAHAGWKGLQSGVIENTIRSLQEEYRADLTKIRVCMGPAIGSCCYEVGREFQEFFPGYVKHKQGRYYLDIKALARQKCIDCGIKPEAVNDVSVCTRCNNETFFSYRAGDGAERMVSILAFDPRGRQSAGR